MYRSNKPFAWFFTSRGGGIKRKKPSSISNDAIRDAFTRKQRRRGGNKVRSTCEIVAQFLWTEAAEDGEPLTTFEYLTAESLASFLRHRVKPDGSVLQRFVLPRGEHNTVIRADWSPQLFMLEKRSNVSRLADRSLDMYQRAVTFEGAAHNSVASAIRQASTSARLRQSCESIAEHIAYTSKRLSLPRRMVLFFKVDCDNNLYLLWCGFCNVPNMRLAAAAAEARAQAHVAGVRLESAVLREKRAGPSDHDTIRAARAEREEALSTMRAASAMRGRERLQPAVLHDASGRPVPTDVGSDAELGSDSSSGSESEEDFSDALNTIRRRQTLQPGGTAGAASRSKGGDGSAASASPSPSRPADPSGMSRLRRAVRLTTEARPGESAPREASNMADVVMQMMAQRRATFMKNSGTPPPGTPETTASAGGREKPAAKRSGTSRMVNAAVSKASVRSGKTDTSSIAVYQRGAHQLPGVVKAEDLEAAVRAGRLGGVDREAARARRDALAEPNNVVAVSRAVTTAVAKLKAMRERAMQRQRAFGFTSTAVKGEYGRAQQKHQSRIERRLHGDEVDRERANERHRHDTAQAAAACPTCSSGRHSTRPFSASMLPRGPSDVTTIVMDRRDSDDGQPTSMGGGNVEFAASATAGGDCDGRRRLRAADKTTSFSNVDTNAPSSPRLRFTVPSTVHGHHAQPFQVLTSATGMPLTHAPKPKTFQCRGCGRAAPSEPKYLVSARTVVRYFETRRRQVQEAARSRVASHGSRSDASAGAGELRTFTGASSPRDTAQQLGVAGTDAGGDDDSVVDGLAIRIDRARPKSSMSTYRGVEGVPGAAIDDAALRNVRVHYQGTEQQSAAPTDIAVLSGGTAGPAEPHYLTSTNASTRMTYRPPPPLKDVFGENIESVAGNDVPAVLVHLVPGGSFERYQAMSHDPDFLYKTLRVCEACCAEYMAHDRAVLDKAAARPVPVPDSELKNVAKPPQRLSAGMADGRHGARAQTGTESSASSTTEGKPAGKARATSAPPRRDNRGHTGTARPYGAAPPEAAEVASRGSTTGARRPISAAPQLQSDSRTPSPRARQTPRPTHSPVKPSQSVPRRPTRGQSARAGRRPGATGRTVRSGDAPPRPVSAAAALPVRGSRANPRSSRRGSSGDDDDDADLEAILADDCNGAGGGSARDATQRTGRSRQVGASFMWDSFENPGVPPEPYRDFEMPPASSPILATRMRVLREERDAEVAANADDEEVGRVAAAHDVGAALESAEARGGTVEEIAEAVTDVVVHAVAEALDHVAVVDGVDDRSGGATPFGSSSPRSRARRRADNGHARGRHSPTARRRAGSPSAAGARGRRRSLASASVATGSSRARQEKAGDDDERASVRRSGTPVRPTASPPPGGDDADKATQHAADEPVPLDDTPGAAQRPRTTANVPRLPIDRAQAIAADEADSTDGCGVEGDADALDYHDAGGRYGDGDGEGRHRTSRSQSARGHATRPDSGGSGRGGTRARGRREPQSARERYAPYAPRYDDPGPRSGLVIRNRHGRYRRGSFDDESPPHGDGRLGFTPVTRDARGSVDAQRRGLRDDPAANEWYHRHSPESRPVDAHALAARLEEHSAEEGAGARLNAGDAHDAAAAGDRRARDAGVSGHVWWSEQWAARRPAPHEAAQLAESENLVLADAYEWAVAHGYRPPRPRRLSEDRVSRAASAAASVSTSATGGPPESPSSRDPLRPAIGPSVSRPTSADPARRDSAGVEGATSARRGGGRKLNRGGSDGANRRRRPTRKRGAALATPEVSPKASRKTGDSRSEEVPVAGDDRPHQGSAGAEQSSDDGVTDGRGASKQQHQQRQGSQGSAVGRDTTASGKASTANGPHASGDVRTDSDSPRAVPTAKTDAEAQQPRGRGVSESDDPAQENVDVGAASQAKTGSKGDATATTEAAQPGPSARRKSKGKGGGKAARAPRKPSTGRFALDTSSSAAREAAAQQRPAPRPGEIHGKPIAAPFR